jgi:WD40 repeat protein
MIKLRPEDFRQGSRNKHIDACSINSAGFLAGGTNHGEVYMWHINFHNIRARKADSCHHWVGAYKLHKKANHYLRFSPSGNMMLTGSADGTSSIWDTSFKKSFNQISNNDEIEITKSNSKQVCFKDIELGSN